MKFRTSANIPESESNESNDKRQAPLFSPTPAKCPPFPCESYENGARCSDHKTRDEPFHACPPAQRGCLVHTLHTQSSPFTINQISGDDKRSRFAFTSRIVRSSLRDSSPLKTDLSLSITEISLEWLFENAEGKSWEYFFPPPRSPT